MSVTKRQRYLADLGLLVCAIVWGLGYVVTKSILTTVGPFHLLAFRVLGGGLFLLLATRPFFRKIPRATIGAGMVVGLFLFLGQGVMIVGLQYTDAGRQAFLVDAYTIVVPFLTWFLYKKRPHPAAFAAGVILLAGIGLLSLEPGSGIGYGDGLSLLAAVFFAVQMVMTGYFCQKQSHQPMHLVLAQLLTSGLCALACSILFEKTPDMTTFTRQTWLAMAYLLVFVTVLGQSLQNLSQRYATPSHTSLIISLEAVVSLIASMCFLGEVMTSKMLLGCGVIFFALFLSHWDK